MVFGHCWKQDKQSSYVGLCLCCVWGGFTPNLSQWMCACCFSLSRNFKVKRGHTSDLGVTFGLCVPESQLTYWPFGERKKPVGVDLMVELDKKIHPGFHLRKAWVWLLGWHPPVAGVSCCIQQRVAILSWEQNLNKGFKVKYQRVSDSMSTVPSCCA